MGKSFDYEADSNRSEWNKGYVNRPHESRDVRLVKESGAKE